jgi:hypothetical protein
VRWLAIQIYINPEGNESRNKGMVEMKKLKAGAGEVVGSEKAAGAACNEAVKVSGFWFLVSGFWFLVSRSIYHQLQSNYLINSNIY